MADDIIERQAAEIAELRAALVREAKEAFMGNIDALDKAGLDAMDAQSILMAVQSWDISTGRARELLRCWVLGMFQAKMLPPCQDIGIGEDDYPIGILADARAEVERLTAEVERLRSALDAIAGSPQWDAASARAYAGIAIARPDFHPSTSAGEG